MSEKTIVKRVCDFCGNEVTINNHLHLEELLLHDTKTGKTEKVIDYDFCNSECLNNFLNKIITNINIPKKEEEIINHAEVLNINGACEFCGSTENVDIDINPYSYEMNGDETLHNICKTCYGEFLADV